MNTPMFDQPTNEVTTFYTDGTLTVVLSRKLSTVQARQFTYRINRLAGVNSSAVVRSSAYDGTTFEIGLNQRYAQVLDAIRADIRKEAVLFLDFLQPEAQQASLF